MIPYGRQDISAEDIEAVVDVLRSDFLTQGPAVPAFEAALVEQAGAAFAVAVNSATSALHLACMALGLGKGDLLWTVPNTFVASANCARYCGADVDFVDIDSQTWNISVERLREKLAVAKRRNRLPKIVVPVHFAGQPTEQEAIWELASDYGFFVVEDASHSIGGAQNGERVGSSRYAHAVVFSFHPVKIVTTAEGGAVLTNDPELAARVRTLRTHGITRDPGEFVRRNVFDGTPPAWYYEQQLLGFNYRMTDLQAALGVSQLRRLNGFVTRRNVLAERYHAGLADLSLQLPHVEEGTTSAYHLYVVRLSAASDRDLLYAALREKGLGVNVHYYPVHLQPYYRTLGFESGQFPEAERHGSTAITLPLYPALSDADQDRVISLVRDFV